eukprot:6362896-Ditylum_brightwellii.AAC.1
MDVSKCGVLPLSRFAELVEELGEGFYGNELSKQLSKVNVEDSGSLVLMEAMRHGILQRGTLLLTRALQYMIKPEGKASVVHLLHYKRM